MYIKYYLYNYFTVDYSYLVFELELIDKHNVIYSINSKYWILDQKIIIIFNNENCKLYQVSDVQNYIHGTRIIRRW